MAAFPCFLGSVFRLKPCWRSPDHSALEMAMNVYAHVTLDDRRDALDKLGDLFEDGQK